MNIESIISRGKNMKLKKPSCFGSLECCVIQHSVNSKSIKPAYLDWEECPHHITCSKKFEKWIKTLPRPPFAKVVNKR